MPVDGDPSVLITRVWDPETQGPRVCVVESDGLVDITHRFSTSSQLMESPDGARDAAKGEKVRWSIDDVVEGSLKGEKNSLRFLAPIDLQVTKACGVTFVGSLIERVIEEKCQGDAERAHSIRAELLTVLDGSLKGVQPGSAKAAEVKRILIEQDLWSQYLEVGIGPDPEVFTKAPVLASVGWGARVGIPAFSSWNNPEPELVLVCNSRGTPVGATLGNDVNLRDVEGRSALLLGKAKDNNASSALGPFIRLFDEHFNLDTASQEEIALRVEGTDGFTMEGRNSIREISRPLVELVDAVHGVHHQYPDGFALYTGTLFAPTQDRSEPGSGFTHRKGDRVEISSPHLGALVNTTWPTDELEPWDFGIGELFRYLSEIDS